MKSVLKKSIAIFLSLLMTFALLPTAVFASVADYPLFSINIVNETDTQATISINLDRGQFEYVTFYVIPNNNISSCESINKSSSFEKITENLENNGNSVLVAANNKDFMVTVASTGKFSQTGSYFEFVLKKITSDKLTKSDLTISVSDIGATFVNNLPSGFGDINFDNQINLADALSVLKYCNQSGKLTDEQLYWADVNRDSVVNTADAYWILRYYEGAISSFSKALILPDSLSAFSVHTLYENKEKASFAVRLDEGSFVSGTFSFAINDKKFTNPVITRSEYFKDLSVEITDNGGYSLFNSNGLCVSLSSTLTLKNPEDYIVLTVDKLSDEPLNPDDIKLSVSDVNATVKNDVSPNKCEHEFVTVITDATCTKEGTVCEKCLKCNEISSTVILPKLLQRAVVDGVNIINVQPAETKDKFIKDNFYSTTASIKFSNLSDDFICTGTNIKVENYNRNIEEYTVIVFGDVNCDGSTDGTDSVILKCIVNGMIPTDTLSAEVKSAADCNHNGSIDENDAKMLDEAGLSLSEINQNKY